MKVSKILQKLGTFLTENVSARAPEVKQVEVLLNIVWSK